VKVVVLGAGAIGCYLGAALSLGGLDVTLIGRGSLKDGTLASGKMQLTDYTGLDTTIPTPEFTSEPAGLASADLILLTTKCLGVEAAGQQIAEFANPTTPVMTFQNGIGSEELLNISNPVIPAIVGFNVAPMGEGRFHRGTEGHIHCTPCQQAAALTLAFAKSGIKFIAEEDFEAVRWAKLQLNLNNAINALSNMPLKAELETRAYRLILSRAMQELLQITKRKGLKLPKLTKLPAPLLPFLIRVPDFLFKRLASQMLAIDPAARSSMWEDLNNGRMTEIDFLNGAVSRAGKEFGVATPVNNALVTLIKQAEYQPLKSVSAKNIQSLFN